MKSGDKAMAAVIKESIDRDFCDGCVYSVVEMIEAMVAARAISDPFFAPGPFLRACGLEG